MANPLVAAGAAPEPTEYACLSMDRHITGLWTQRSPLRDADVPYLYGKFYSASRFDSLIDGLNREMTAKLNSTRRAGTSVWNANTFPAINSFFAFKLMQNGVETIRTLVDGLDGKIYDATGGGKITLFTKAGGAGKARFAGIGNTLYFSDGVENKKWLQPAGWLAQTSLATSQYQVGTTVIDSNGNIEYLNAVQVGNITNVALTSNTVQLTFNNTNFNLAVGNSFTPSGLGAGAFLNGVKLVAISVIPVAATFVVTAVFPHVNYASAPDTGIATTTDVFTGATTGGSQPVWNGAVGGTTADGLSTWTNFGNPIFDWGPPNAPAQAPTIGKASPRMSTWQPFQHYGGELIVDAGGNIQQAFAPVGSFSGSKLPIFSTSGQPGFPTGQVAVSDGSMQWAFCGNIRDVWQAGQAYTNPPLAVAGGYCIVDNNGNVQQVSVGGTTGATQPAVWNQTIGGTTADNTVTWTNMGPALALAFTGWKYGYAWHCIDGSVSNISPLTPLTNGVLGGNTLGGKGSSSPQVDSVWIFRTADGQPTPLFLASVPNPGGSSLWSYVDQNLDANLISQIAAPQTSSNNPPPFGMTAPVFHQGRMWAILNNMIVSSGGPNILTGNGFTAWAPLSNFPITEQPIRLFSGVTNQGPTLFIFGNSNIWAIFGNGTPQNPFTSASVYMGSVGILSYDAVRLVGSTFYAFTNKNKFVALDPSAGYVEHGFPIGDQFTKVTTGFANASLYSPASTYVSWAELGSGDTAIYVADGTIGWFRFSPVTSPESGYVWSPRAAILAGTSAVQDVETSPGIAQLLIGPTSGTGPILFRDPTVNTDWTGGQAIAYESYQTLGNIVLCQSGEVAEIAHIGLKSIAVGTRPTVSLLLGEISATAGQAFDVLAITSADPPDLPESTTMFSDRYTALQNGVCPKCDNFQLKIDYGAQSVPDELLMFSIYGAKHSERRQQ